MKTLTFQGYGDDTFGEESTGKDHDNCANGEPIAFRVHGGGETLLVVGQYAPESMCPTVGPTWLVGITADDIDETDNEVIPSWPMKFTQGEYGPALIIEAPDDARVEYVDAKAERERIFLRRTEAREKANREAKRAQLAKLKAELGE